MGSLKREILKWIPELKSKYLIKFILFFNYYHEIKITYHLFYIININNKEITQRFILILNEYEAGQSPFISPNLKEGKS